MATTPEAKVSGKKRPLSTSERFWAAAGICRICGEHRDDSYGHRIFPRQNDCPCHGSDSRVHRECLADINVERNDRLVERCAREGKPLDRDEFCRPWEECPDCGRLYEQYDLSSALGTACVEAYKGLAETDERKILAKRIYETRFDVSYRERERRRKEERIANNSASASIPPLPEQLTSEVLIYLDIPSLNAVMRTSKAISKVARSDRIWELHLKQMLHKVFDGIFSHSASQSGYGTVPPPTPISERPDFAKSTAFCDWLNEAGTSS